LTPIVKPHYNYSIIMSEYSFILIEGVIMAPTRQERKKNITTMREQQILDAALTVFSEKGFATATTAEIAKAAGVAEGTIYNYFSSKRELFIAVIKNFIITAPLQEMLEKLPQADSPLIFKKILQERLIFGADTKIAHLSSLMSEIQRDPELRALYAEQFIQPFLAKMSSGYEDMMAEGKIRRMEPAIVTRAIGGLILGFLMLKMIEGETSPVNRLPQEKVAEEIMGLVLYGILTDGDKNMMEKDGAK
jgi:AcrR family transcriptional regulator